jgi:hypothetical protein
MGVLCFLFVFSVVQFLQAARCVRNAMPKICFFVLSGFKSHMINENSGGGFPPFDRSKKIL